MFKGISAPEESKAEWDFPDVRGKPLETTLDTNLQAGLHWTILSVRLLTGKSGKLCHATGTRNLST